MQLPTGTVTFLFTDIEGSTRLWEESPDQMRTALARHDALLRQTIEGAGGVVFKTVGDAFCAVFARAGDAAQATLAGQQALQSEAWPSQTPLRVRMALHTGGAQDRDNDYFGPVVNRVARLLAAGHGGQVLVSEACREQVGGSVELRDLGSHRLKDLDRPEQIYQLVAGDRDRDFPPLKTLTPTRSNLPVQLTSFIGREKELAQARTQLAGTRLLTLTGPGGTGKTRLSQQLAADALEDFADGIWLVELAPLTDAALVPQTVAQALGLRDQPGQTPLQTLTDFLKPRQLLLLLDNGEHVIAACAALASALLRACPNLRILVTSREPLGTSGEVNFRVPSLSLPDAQGRKTATARSLERYESARLLIERAQLVKPDFAVTDRNAPAVAQICFRLDGIPLAMELAAARTRSLSVEQINDKLDQRFRLLTGGDRAALPRQQTLRALVDWSYDLLSENERTLMARLSVFAGGWSLEAAEAVCAGDAIEDWEILDLLTSLVDKSLVLAEEDSGATRYRMLETLRQYGVEKLAASDDAGAIAVRFREYLLSVARTEPGVQNTPAWYRRIEIEHDNFRAALATCEANGETEAGIHLVEEVSQFWMIRGYFAEAQENLGRLIARARTQPEVAARYLAPLLRQTGKIALQQGEVAQAGAFLEESVALLRQQPLSVGLPGALNDLAIANSMQGNHAVVKPLMEEALAHHRTLGNTVGIMTLLNNLGSITWGQGDDAAALGLFEESLMLARQHNDPTSISSALGNIGNISRRRGQLDLARQQMEEALAIRREFGAKRAIAHLVFNLGTLTIDQGDYPAARARFDEALALYQEMGDKAGIPLALEGLAHVCLRTDALEHAALLWGTAHTLRTSSQLPLSPSEERERQALEEEARTRLGAPAFTTAYNNGQTLSPDAAHRAAQS